MISISSNLNVMIKAVEKASKLVIRDFGEVEKLQVSVKGPSNFVSNADTKAEKIIIEEIGPSFKVLGEAVTAYTDRTYPDHSFKVKVPDNYVS